MLTDGWEKKNHENSRNHELVNFLTGLLLVFEKKYHETAWA